MHQSSKLGLFVEENLQSIRVCLALVFLWAPFYLMAHNGWFIHTVLHRIALCVALVVELLLRSLGNDVLRTGVIVQGTSVQLEVIHSCTGIYQITAFAVAVLAYPASLVSKMIGLFRGALYISAINVLRIATVFYAGTYFPIFLPVLHTIIWEALMILLTVVVWLAWAKRTNDS